MINIECKVKIGMALALVLPLPARLASLMGTALLQGRYYIKQSYKGIYTCHG